MKIKKVKPSDNLPYLPTYSSDDFEGYKITYPSYVTEQKENEKSISEIEGEFFTVRYEITMNSKRRRLLLQTVLDKVLWAEHPYLNLADYMLIENLAFSIQELDSPEREDQEKYRDYLEELLGVSFYVLTTIPLRTKTGLMVNYEINGENIRNLINSECKAFKVSDKRTLNSRLNSYFPGKIVSFTVEVPLIQPENRNSIPYSSYTKGYGESHPKHLGTAKDWELDGQDVWEFQRSQTLKPRPIPAPKVDPSESSENVTDS